VDDDELATLRDSAKGWVPADVGALANAVGEGLIKEVTCDDEENA